MATLATHFRDTERLNAAGAQAVRMPEVEMRDAAGLLRPLPNDAIYFYSKKIDNSRGTFLGSLNLSKS